MYKFTDVFDVSILSATINTLSQEHFSMRDLNQNISPGADRGAGAENHLYLKGSC